MTPGEREADPDGGPPPVLRSGFGADRTRPSPPDEDDLTAGQRVLLDAWTAERHAKTRRFVHHLAVHGAFHSRRNDGFVPVDARYIRAEFRQAEREIPALVASGLVEMRRHDRARGLSREYRLGPSLVAAFHGAPLDDVPDQGTVAPRDLPRVVGRVTGGVVDEPPAVTAFVDDKGEPYPGLVVGALRAVRSSPVDLPAVLAYLRDLRDSVVSAETAHGPLSRESRRAFGRFVQAQSAVRAVLRQRPVPTADGLHAYDVALNVQSSGRLGEAGGGLQAAPAALKAAARGGIPGVRNYDLPSAQPRLALVRMAAEGLEAPALERYVLDPDERGRLGDASGLGPAVKRAVLAGLMGAVFPTPDQALLAKDRLSQVVLAAAGVDWEDWNERSTPHGERLGSSAVVREALGRSAGALAPLFAEFGRWHRRLRTFQVGGAASVEGVLAGPVVRNRLGMPLAVGSVNGRLRGPDLGRVVAHLLQGDEAAYVHSLTVGLDRAGVRVLGNEHDGLVVWGEILREVEGAAAAAVGLPFIGMVQKPFG